ncbi:6-phosphogluconolactonase [Aestuariivirga litoralis]|uniref:6-phosphogluconolactonase n=1 Tax=Aestuariivirga litoralis TaxID=2650924 RepID=UPI0018C4C9F9|nr:6-phosphogluconolactonase [Aestuariivirga litoralis]MBG1232895.1 6-phosphogluconolactonase [Aestuariivirga litoralis]
MTLTRHDFDNPAKLASALATDVGQHLQDANVKTGRAVLAVSGGTTPKQFFDTLSRDAAVDWSKVIVTLVDERQVDETSDRSNARLVKASLMQNVAAAATFVPLYQNPDAASIPAFDVVILGMGNDGHTASFFPGGDTLDLALSVSAPDLVEISAPGSGEPRITFSLPRLLAAKFLKLHVQGADKQATLEKALGAGDVKDMPIRAVLRSSHPIEIYWCP